MERCLNRIAGSLPAFVPALILAVLAGPVPPALADDERAAAAAELDSVRERIETLAKELEQASRKRGAAEQDLRRVEKAEQGARRELDEIRRKSATTEARAAELRERERAQAAALDAHKTQLAEQVRLAHRSGGPEWLRVLLSQDDVGAVGRRMAYYGYVARSRTEAIGQLRELLDSLAATRAAIGRELEELRALERSAVAKLEEIAAQRAERARLLAKIDATITNSDAEIRKLRSQEQELGELVAELGRRLPAMPDFDAEPFAGQTDSLAWPAEGKVLRRFGEKRADGSLRWNGVLLGAPAGSDVRAVYHGRIVFSDWLDGMGLLTIIEHDGGYMSLYGHNQALLTEVGDWVMPGETIAQVGDSGGQATAGLYFEIRRDGEPVDPARWIR